MDRRIIDLGIENKKKLLVVDDNADLAQMLRDVFRGDFFVYTAGDGKEAIRQARERKPDLIIMDMMMPEMGGYESLRQFQSHPEIRSIPIMIHTGFNFDASTLDLIRQEPNVVEVLHKPVPLHLLRQKVEQFFKK